jgi:hypothetical protein
MWGEWGMFGKGEKCLENVGFEVLTAVVNVTILCDIAPCSSYVNQRFRGMYHPHLQYRKLVEQEPMCSRWLPSIEDDVIHALKSCWSQLKESVFYFWGVKERIHFKDQDLDRRIINFKFYLKENVRAMWTWLLWPRARANAVINLPVPKSRLCRLTLNNLLIIQEGPYFTELVTGL